MSVTDELQKDFETFQINKALFSQLLCTALQIALVNLLDSWNIRPNSVTGHSSGEIAAAYCADAIGLEDAMLLAYARGCAATELAGKGVDGAMAAVSMTREELGPILLDLRSGKAVIACSNSPSSMTVSGDKTALDELQQMLREQGVYNRRLVVGVAYHSHHMALVEDDYRADISNIQSGEGSQVDFFSSVTGKLTEKSNLGPDYWVRNLVSEVKFGQSLRQLASHEGPDGTPRVQTLIEIAPHAALAGPIRQILEADKGPPRSSIEYLAVLTRKNDAVATALGVASSLFISGHTVSLSAVNQNQMSKIPPLIDLPPYFWNHTRTYSADSRINKAYRERVHPRTDLLGVLDIHSSALMPRWRQVIRLSELPWLRDHSFQYAIIYPAAGYITMAIEAARQRVLQAAPETLAQGYEFRDVDISSALIIPETPGEVEVVITLKISVRTPSDLWDEFLVSSVSSENRWTEHCRGLIAVQKTLKASNPVNGPAHENSIEASNKCLVEHLQAICQKTLDLAEFYSHLSQIGMQYGATFANIRDAHSAPGRCISRVVIPNTKAVLLMCYEQASVVHPGTLDSIFQTYLPALAEQIGQLFNPVIPVCIEICSLPMKFRSSQATCFPRIHHRLVRAIASFPRT
jgi:acyl transferase domain-containing protein